MHTGHNTVRFTCSDFEITLENRTDYELAFRELYSPVEVWGHPLRCEIILEFNSKEEATQFKNNFSFKHDLLRLEKHIKESG